MWSATLRLNSVPLNTLNMGSMREFLYLSACSHRSTCSCHTLFFIAHTLVPRLHPHTQYLSSTLLPRRTFQTLFPLGIDINLSSSQHFAAPLSLPPDLDFLIYSPLLTTHHRSNLGSRERDLRPINRKIDTTHTVSHHVLFTLKSGLELFDVY